jgi:hypothetical protein
MLEADICQEFYAQYEELSLLGQFKSDPLVFHVPNERRTSQQYGAKLKRMGVVSGVGDYCVVYEGGRVAFIEFKRNAKCKLSIAQEHFKNSCEDLKVPYLLTYRVDEAIDFLKSL